MTLLEYLQRQLSDLNYDIYNTKSHGNSTVSLEAKRVQLVEWIEQLQAGQCIS